jgi:hypothetical protein
MNPFVAMMRTAQKRTYQMIPSDEAAIIDADEEGDPSYKKPSYNKENQIEPPISKEFLKMEWIKPLLELNAQNIKIYMSFLAGGLMFIFILLMIDAKFSSVINCLEGPTLDWTYYIPPILALVGSCGFMYSDLPGVFFPNPEIIKWRVVFVLSITLQTFGFGYSAVYLGVIYGPTGCPGPGIELFFACFTIIISALLYKLTILIKV